MAFELSTISFHTWGLVVLVGVMVVTFVTQRLPVDVTAMGVLLVLVLGRYVTPSEAFEGFSSPVVVVLVSTLFVVAALRATGVSDALARWIQRCAGASEPIVIGVVMLVAAFLSAFMNNASAAALLMPAVAVLAYDTEIPPSRLFIPLAFAVSLGGMLTLIGTPPNIMAAELLRQRGMEPFHFFDFALYGLPALIAGTLFMSTIGYRLLPIRKTQRRRKRITDLRALYHLEERLFSLRVPDGSTLDGKTLADLRFSALVGGVVVTILRGGRKLLSPHASEKLAERDVLIVKGNPERFALLHSSHGLAAATVSSEIIKALVDSSEIVRFKIRDVHTESHTMLLRDVLRSSGIVPLAVERVSEDGAWESVSPSWFLDSVVHSGDVIVGAISGRFAEDSPSMDVELKVIEHPSDVLAEHLHVISVEKAGWSGAPLHRLAHETKISILGRVTSDNRIEWLDVPSILPGGERGPVRLAADHVLRDGETYLVSGPFEEAQRREMLGSMVVEAEATEPDIESPDVGIVELILTPRSELIGRTLADLHFREKYNSQVLALWRDGKPLLSLSSKLPLVYGDALLIQGPRTSFDILAKDPDVLLLSDHKQAPKLSIKSLFALLGLSMLMFLPLVSAIPVHEAAFMAACLVVFSRAISMEQVYREIEWKIVFLLALVIPLGKAVENAAAADVVVGLFRHLAGAMPGSALVVLLIIGSSAISQLVDGALAVIFLGPIALSMAQQTGDSPRTLLMAVALGASLSFMLPVSCRSNLLVTGAGGYRGSDFMKVGLPFTIVVGATLFIVLHLF